MSFPVTDWQFWVVTALAACAAAWLIRGLVRFILHARRGKSAPKRAMLTIDGRAVSRPKDDP
jgi:hypothetical protein